MNERRTEIVEAFCEDCVWAYAVRTHFARLFESGVQRHRLMAEIANTFCHDLTAFLLEYVLLQQNKLSAPASSGVGKENLTTNYLLTLEWTDATRVSMLAANQRLMVFRAKICDARRKLIAHSDLHSRLQLRSLGE